jgi:hypothetical protein
MLISTVLLSLILLGLYGALNLQKNSNKHLFEYLSKALTADRGAMVLYRDIFQSDGNITLKNGEFDRLCLNNTSHSLHGLAQAKVCWIVAKENKALLRIEWNGFHLPLKHSDGVFVDEVMKPTALFDIQKDKKKVLVGLEQVNRDPYIFLVQGVEPPPKKKPENNKNNSTPGKGKKNSSKKQQSMNRQGEKRQKTSIPPANRGEGIPPGMEPDSDSSRGAGRPNMF